MMRHKTSGIRGSTPACAVAAAAFLVTATAAVPADASWVRGKGFAGPAGTIDPLYQSTPLHPPIPTVSVGSFTDAFRAFHSEADLGNGALRGRVIAQAGAGSVSVNPVLGETVTFHNAGTETTSWNFDFAIDGHVTSGSQPFPVEQTFGDLGTFRTTFIQFALHIFPGHTVGPIGSANSWFDQIGNALFSETRNINGFPITGNLEAFDALLEDSISGSLDLAPGVNHFDVVMVLALAASVPANTGSSIDMNFLSTAALTIDSPVDFTSDSGYFLTGNNIIPEPAMATLAAIMMAGPVMLRRRRSA